MRSTCPVTLLAPPSGESGGAAALGGSRTGHPHVRRGRRGRRRGHRRQPLHEHAGDADLTTNPDGGHLTPPNQPADRLRVDGKRLGHVGHGQQLRTTHDALLESK